MAKVYEFTDLEAELLDIFLDEIEENLDEAKLATMLDRDPSVTMEEMLEAVDGLRTTKEMVGNIRTTIRKGIFQ